MRNIVLAAGCAALALHMPAMAKTKEERAAERAEKERLGSLYLRCDGKPNNMSDGESFARILGAVTLLAIFAPAPETPDPSKRLFGEEGVKACDELLDGAKPEGNGLRRLPLIVARGIHQIEAKNYDAALADIAKARVEAQALGLLGNPYFDRSFGLSFGALEAEARLRKDDPAGAQQAALGQVTGMRFSMVPILTAQQYAEFLPQLSAQEEQIHDAEARIMPGGLNSYASRLEEAGRFADAAAKREALIATLEELKPEHASSGPYAWAAVSHALAGDAARAQERADFARSNLAARRAAGVAETNASAVVELLDLYDIIRAAGAGDLTAARRSFAARSQWLEPGLGAVMEVNRRLRAGAEPAELFGALAKSANEMWQERRDTALATRLQKDTDNRSLFAYQLPYAEINAFEDRSKDTWRIVKSKMMSDKPDEKTGMWRIFAYGNVQTLGDSIMLHAALQAQAQGKDGFTMIFSLPTRDQYLGSIGVGTVRFVNRGETGADPARFIEAAPVIAELSQLIPSPDELKRRKQQRKNAG
jgi:hypothetical protein